MVQALLKKWWVESDFKDIGRRTILFKYYFRNCKFKYIYIINSYNKSCQCVTFLIEVPVPRQKSEASCICLLGISMLPLFASIFIFDVGFVQTVWYFLFSFY
jgi:hypothetical protein